MSKSASTATLFPAWKQEVNRRVAAHLSRKTTFASESAPAQGGRPTHGSRAAQAAARVAERYAQAPSYSELLADEARNAMRAAEAASEAARQAHAAVLYVLDGLEAAAAPEQESYSEFEASIRRFDEALQSYDRAIQLKPDYPEAHNNRGIVLQELERFDEALQSYDRAIQLKPDYPEAYNNRGIALQELRRFDEALQSYDRAIQLKPDYPEAHYNRGNALKELRRLDEALQSYDRAIQLKPDYPEAHYNRGNALKELKRFDEALQSYDRAIQLKSDYPEAHFNRGIVLKELKRFDEALQSYERALQLKPDNDFWLGMWFYVSLGCCNWENLDKNKDEILHGIIKNKKLIGPFATMLLTDSLDIQEQSAKIWVKDKCFSNNSTNKLTKYPLHDKIRIGYFSADFHNHATLHLMAEMFEKHDRSRYELYGFSFGPESNDPWRERSQRCFDRFFDVRFKSDQDIAEFARDLQIDIAVDLKGFTSRFTTKHLRRACSACPGKLSWFPRHNGSGVY